MASKSPSRVSSKKIGREVHNPVVVEEGEGTCGNVMDSGGLASERLDTSSLLLRTQVTVATLVQIVPGVDNMRRPVSVNGLVI
jgi:hypothetical protein